MNILIVNPPAVDSVDYIREGRCMQRKTSWASLWMPLTLAYCASVLRQQGHEVRLIDCVADRIDPASLCLVAKRFDPGLIVINTAFPSIGGDMQSAGMLKETCPSTHIAVIGMCATLAGQALLAQYADVDFSVVGEPEWALGHLAASLAGKEPLKTVKGLVFREGGAVAVNPPQEMSLHDLDDLPFPARDLLNNDAYRLPAWGEKFTLVSIGRGCPSSCTFCVANVFYGKKFRKRSARSVVDEIQDCTRHHGINNFLFWGESFTLDTVYGGQICDEILGRNLIIRWSTTSRVDTLNADLLRKMRRSGCTLLGLGIESAAQSVLDGTGKGTTVDMIREAIRTAHDAGIQVMGHFIFGLPGDTMDTARETIRFACSSGIEFAQFYCAVPYQGTELGKLARKNGWVVSEDFGSYDLSRSVMRNESLAPEDVMGLRDLAYRKFYIRPSAALRLVKEARSLRSLLAASQFLGWMKPRR